MPAPRVALLVNLGTPSAPTPDAVRAFLGEFLADPCVVDWPAWLWRPILRGIVLRRRPARIAEAYRAIWSADGAPLAVQTRALAAAVQRELGDDWEVRASYRYGVPGLARELAALREAGRDVRVLPLFPQRTAASSGTIARAVEASGAARLVELSPTDPTYVGALASSLHATMASSKLGAPRKSQLVVSFHSIPRRVDRAERARYSSDCRATFDALRAAAGWPRENAELCFQSRFGPEPWLVPALADRLVALGRAHREVVVTTPGFLTEGLETLEEIDLRGRAAFARAGGAQFLRSPCPAAEPSLARALAGVLLRDVECR